MFGNCMPTVTLVTNGVNPSVQIARDHVCIHSVSIVVIGFTVKSILCTIYPRMAGRNTVLVYILLLAAIETRGTFFYVILFVKCSRNCCERFFFTVHLASSL